MKRSLLVLGCIVLPSIVIGDDAVRVRFDSGDLSRVAQRVQPRGRVEVDAVPLGVTEVVRLSLQRVEAFTPDARIVVHGAEKVTELPLPPTRYFRGTVAGERSSMVLLTVSGSGAMRGVVSRGNEHWELVAAADQVTPAALRKLDSSKGPAGGSPSFDCQTDDHLPAGHNGEPPSLSRVLQAHEQGPAVDAGATRVARAAAAVSHTARIAIETDYEYYSKFGNASDAADYAAALIAYISGIYEAEVDTSLLVSSVSLWSVAGDPWDESPGSCGLYEFGAYWNANNGGIDRTLAHFLSGKSTNAGVAWIGVLCNGGFNQGSVMCTAGTYSNYGGDYGYTGGIDAVGGFGLIWDVLGVAHEIGHNFNSPHTHCYGNLEGNPSQVDTCYGGQCGNSGCWCGGASLPGPSGGGSGTIMSYCHLIGPGYISNTSLTFGLGHPYGTAPERVPTRMSSHVVSSAAAYPGCLDYVEADLIFSDGFESGDLTDWSSSQP